MPRSSHQLVSSLMLASAVLAGALAVGGCTPDTQEARANAGKVLMQKKDYKGAVVHFKSALQLDPNSAEIRFLLGQTLLESGDPIGASVELQKSLDLQGSSEKVLPVLARALLINGEDKKLTSKFADIDLSDRQAAASLKASLAKAWFGVGNTAKAKAAIADSLAAVPENAPALTLSARSMAEQGRLDEAMAVLERVLARDAAQPEAWALKGEILLAARNDAAGAIAALQKATSIDPKFTAAMVSLVAIKLRVQSDLPGAKAEAEKLRAVLPKHPQMMYIDAILAYASKDFQKSRELVQLLMRLAPDDVGLVGLAGAVESELGALGVAETFFNKALAIDPQLVLPRINLAQIYLRQGQPNRTLDVLKPLLGINAVNADAQRLAGDAHLRLGDAQAAEAAFNKAAKIHPGDVRTAATRALLQLGQGNASQALADLTALSAKSDDTVPDRALLSAHMGRGDLDAALAAANNMLKKAPSDASAFEALGGLQIRRRDLAAARVAYTQALKLDPAFLAATIALSAIDVLEKKPEAAQKRLEESIKATPKSPYPRQALAELKLRNGAPAAEVATLLDEAIKLMPSDTDLRLQRVDLALQKRLFKDALAAAQDAAAALPNDTRVMEALGRAQMAAGSQEQAVNTFRRLIGLDPKSVLPYSRLADIYEATGKLKDAEVILKRAVEVQPDSAPLHSALMKVLLKQGRPNDALVLVAKVQRERPDSELGYMLEGQLHVDTKAPDRAVAAIRKGLAKIPDSSRLAVAQYSLLRSGGRADEVDRFGDAWLQKHPNDAVFAFQVATTHVRRGDLDSAEAMLVKVLARFPNDPLTLNNLAWVQALRKKPEAVTNAQRAVDARPREAVMVDTLATALAANNRLSEALTAQKRAVDLAPDDNDLRLNLAKIALGAGDKAVARAELDRLQALGARFRAQSQVTELQKQL